MEGCVVVRARGGARRVASLGLECDGHEFPELLDGGELEHWWIAARCIFGGKASVEQGDGQLGQPKPYTTDGPATFAIGQGLFVGLITPMSKDKPALWWSWALSSVTVIAHGTQGMFKKKRPQKIQVDRNGGALNSGGDSLILSTVSEVYRESRQFEAAQEELLLHALGG